jgi:hypothetical protein
LPALRLNTAIKSVRDAKAFMNVEVSVVRRAPDGEPVRTASEPEAGALPDFIIIGAEKCRTTILYHHLRLHPYARPPRRKELHYFDLNFARGVDWYRAQFSSPEWKDGRRIITGEASPYYLHHPHAARRIMETVPQVRLIALLRDPVDRAYSAYQHRIREGFETLSFEEAIEAEEERLHGETEKMLEDEHYFSLDHRRFSYLSRGIYVDRLPEWHGYFGWDQLLVLKSEDVLDHKRKTLQNVSQFLGLPIRHTEAYGFLNEGFYPPMKPATRRRLEEYFEPHNTRLYEYLGEDFGW